MDENIGETKEYDAKEYDAKEYDVEKEEEDKITVYRKPSIKLKINKQTIEQLKQKEENEKEIRNYFRDKSKYEKKIHDVKNKLRKTKGLSTKDKRREFKNSLKCIKCGKKGGTLFINENNVLKEVCNAENRCSLNVEIKRITVDNLVDLERKYNKELNDVKKQIVIANMDLLFKYKSKNEVATLFNDKLNVSLEKSTENLRSCVELLSSIVNKNKDDINKLEESLKIEMKELTVEDLSDKQIVEKYIRFILPLLKELRTLKYSYSGTECESTLDETPCSQSKDNIYVVQTPFTIKDMEIETRK